MPRIKKVKLPFEQGENPMFIGTISTDGEEIKTVHLLTLSRFSVIDGSISGTVRDDRGRITIGGSEMMDIIGTNITMKPSVPLTMHERQLSGQALAPEFIFCIPSNLQVYPLSSVKKKYSLTKTSPYKLG